MLNLYYIVSVNNNKEREYIHTVTKLGTVSIPIPLRRKYGITKGSKIKFVDSSDGIRLIPLVSLHHMFGIDKGNAALIRKILHDIIEARKGAT